MVVTAMWSVLLALLTLVAVAVVALPWNAALGGVTSQVTDQVGAVVPGLLASAILLGLFGLGFGTLVKNQVAGDPAHHRRDAHSRGAPDRRWPGPSSTTT